MPLKLYLLLGCCAAVLAGTGALVVYERHQGAHSQAAKDAPAITQGVVSAGAAQAATQTTQAVTGREAYEARIANRQQHHVEALEGAPSDGAAYVAYLDWLHDRDGAPAGADLRGVSGGPGPQDPPGAPEGPR